jgi:glycosyltransferase involved in cell wall biosynthesis
MASGRPILCLAPQNSEIYRLVKDTDSGVSVESGDIIKTKDAILELKESPDRCRALAANARNYVLKNFSREKIVSEYEKILEEEAK